MTKLPILPFSRKKNLRKKAKNRATFVSKNSISADVFNNILK